MPHPMPDRYALVLAGGRGERFWPWSRPERPKQLLPLAHGGRSLLAATLDRLRPLIPPSRCLVMTARDLVPAVERECPRGTRVIGEPGGRKTAPAIAAAVPRGRVHREAEPREGRVVSSERRLFVERGHLRLARRRVPRRARGQPAGAVPGVAAPGARRRRIRGRARGRIAGV